jgi:hypothetical protein
LQESNEIRAHNGKRFLYSAVHSPFSPLEIEITEAGAFICRKATKFERITENGSSIPQLSAHAHQFAFGLYAD